MTSHGQQVKVAWVVGTGRACHLDVAPDPARVFQNVATHELFQYQRSPLQLSAGSTPHEKIMRSIEPFGPEIATVVRRETGASVP